MAVAVGPPYQGESVVTGMAKELSAPGRRGVIWPVPSWLALNGPFDFVGRPIKMLAAERFCRAIEETMDAVANELERILAS